MNFEGFPKIVRSQEEVIAESGERALHFELREKMKRLEVVAPRFAKFFDTKGEKRWLDEEQITEMIEMIPREDDVVEIDSEKQALENVKEFFETEDVKKKREITTAIAAWCEKDITQVDVVQEEVSKYIRKAKKLDYSTLIMLGEIDQGILTVAEPLAFELERVDRQQRLLEQLGVILELNDSGLNLQMHKVTDFLSSYLTTLQNDMDGKIENEYPTGFFDQFRDFLEDNIDKTKNYLLKRHLEDWYEAIDVQAYRKEKPGMLHGVSGGATDQVIYTHRHLKDSDELRKKFGVRSGYELVNPVLPLAPGYYGYYSFGKLKTVIPEQEGKDPEEIDQKYIGLNRKEDEDIYDELNRPLLDEPFHKRHPSNKLRKFETVWDFDKELEREGREFYFDLDKVDKDELHPFIYADLVYRNSEIIKKHEGEGIDAKQISLQEYLHLLFPTGEIKEEDQYLYEYFSSLSFRKKIEDEFGFDLDEVSLWEQKGFLKFLSTATVEQAARLQKLINKFGIDAVTVFTATDYDVQLGDKIIALSEALPKEQADKIFGKYNEIVDLKSEVEGRVTTFLGEDDQESVRKAMRNIFDKAKTFLEQFSDRILRAKEQLDEASLQETLEEMDQIKTEVVLFGTLYKTLSERDQEVDLEAIVGAEVSQKSADELTREEKNEMYQLFLRGRKKHFSDEINQKDLAAFKDRLEQTTDQTFVTQLRSDGKLVAFMRFDQNPDGTLHGASLNSSPDALGNSIGISFLESALAKAKEKGEILGEVALVPYTIENYVNRLGAEMYDVSVDPKSGFVLFHIRIEKAGAKELIIDKEQKVSLDLKDPKDQEYIKTELKDLFGQGYIVRRVNQKEGGEMDFYLEHVAEPQSVAA